MKPVGRKLGMNPGMRALLIAPPRGYLKLLAPLSDSLTVSSRAAGNYSFVQIFAKKQKAPGLEWIPTLALRGKPS
jgi:hypothetical protein